MNRLVVVAVALVVVASSSARAAAPGRVPVQGYLTATSGAALEGSFDVRFAIWDVATGGANPIYVEHQTISVEQGLFSAEIGAVTPLDLDLFAGASDLWLGVALVDDVEMQPRIHLATTPYAAYAHQAGTAAFADSAGDATTLTGLAATDFRAAADAISFTELTDVPAGLADGDDDSDVLGGLSCATGLVPRSQGVGLWACEPAIHDVACTPGDVVTGFAANGLPTCDPDDVLSEAEVVAFAAANGFIAGPASCTTGSVMKGVLSTGLPNCVADNDTTYNGTDFALANRSCAAGSVMTGISSTGAPVCTVFDTLVRTYVNTNCYLYFGQLDGCDACTSAPNPVGRVSNGACDVINDTQNTDTACQTTTLDGNLIRLFGLAVDGSMDSNDKLFVGLRCF